VAYFFCAQLTPLTFALQNGGIRYEKAYMGGHINYGPAKLHFLKY
jgi:hypothetical protein